jgi:hypothetical protein
MTTDADAELRLERELRERRLAEQERVAVEEAESAGLPSPFESSSLRGDRQPTLRQDLEEACERDALPVVRQGRSEAAARRTLQLP